VNTPIVPEVAKLDSQEAALLASLDRIGFERVAAETNDLDGVELGRQWLSFVDAEITRRRRDDAR
jgi:hypothetical protein